MIGRLRGELAAIDQNTVLLDVHGVGYDVAVPASVLPFLPPLGEETVLLIRQIFREDGVTLFGFLEPFQRRIFDLLLLTKGCGPKAALSLLGSMSAEEIATAIQVEDAKALARAPGVGVRMAERIIVELKDKVQDEVLLRKATSPGLAAAVRRTASPDDELIDGLLGLGYRRSEAEKAVEASGDPSDPIEERLRRAIQVLTK